MSFVTKLTSGGRLHVCKNQLHLERPEYGCGDSTTGEAGGRRPECRRERRSVRHTPDLSGRQRPGRGRIHEMFVNTHR